MNETKLRKLLREEPVPAAAEAERRGRALITRAYAERQPANRPVLPRLALALAVAALLAVLVLSPAGAAVRSWIDDVFTAGVRNAQPALTDIPGGGSLLVRSSSGPWVVHPDGSRRLLGRYQQAAWSPHGLFVATASGRVLSALEPDGTPRWSISAPASVRDPRWSPSGFRIAYRAGRSLRVVAADGSGDKLLVARTAPVAPAWFPPGLHLLAYADAAGRVRIANADTGALAASAATTASAVGGLSWSSDGTQLLQSAGNGLWIRRVNVRKLAGSLALGPARRLRLPAGATVGAASFAPQTDTIAVLLRRPTRNGGRNEAVLLDPAGGPLRRLFAISGRLSGLAWAPDGSRLLVGWPAADQWLFLPLTAGRIEAVDEISAAFAPGDRRPLRFPQIEGWCCAQAPAETLNRPRPLSPPRAVAGPG